MGNELDVVARASVALGSSAHEKALRDLVVKAAGVKAISNRAGYKECHATRMSLRTARLAIADAGKAAREDAQTFAKAVITEEKRLVAIVEPEEARLKQMQDEWDARIAAEKAEKEAAENARVRTIRAKIDNIKAWALKAAGMSAAEIADVLDRVGNGIIITKDEFEEFAVEADEVRSETLLALSRLLGAAETLEKQQAEIIAERKKIAEERAKAAAEEAKRVKLANLQIGPAGDSIPLVEPMPLKPTLTIDPGTIPGPDGLTPIERSSCLPPKDVAYQVELCAIKADLRAAADQTGAPLFLPWKRIDHNIFSDALGFVAQCVDECIAQAIVDAMNQK